jgi:membrane protein
MKNFLWILLKETYLEWKVDKVPRLAAALAYYALFSITPLLVIVIAIVGFLFGQEAAQGQIMNQIKDLIGEAGAQAVERMIKSAHNPASGIIATLFAIVMLLLGATFVFSQIRDALNTIWEVTPKPASGITSFLKDRFVSFIMILGIGFLLLLSFVMSALLSAFGDFLNSLFPKLAFTVQIINFIISFGVITLLFAMVYKILPDVEIAWSDVWLGSAITSLLFTIGKFLIGWYIGKSGVASVYGAASSVVIILVWIYYSAQIFLFGAEFTQVYANKYGSGMKPTEGATLASEKEKEGSKA